MTALNMNIISKLLKNIKHKLLKNIKPQIHAPTMLDPKYKTQMYINPIKVDGYTNHM